MFYKINLFILLFFIKNSFTFYEDQISVKYNVICQNNNEECEHIHCFYKEYATKLFKIWNTLDLLSSIQCGLPSDDSIFYPIINDILKMAIELNNLKDNDLFMLHEKDNQEIINLLNYLIEHQAITCNKCIKNGLYLCLLILQNKKTNIYETKIDYKELS
jgi:hypothetical protein